MIGGRDIAFIDSQIAKGKNIPSFLDGYESAQDRPQRDHFYYTIMRAFYQLRQASSTPTFLMQEMASYHDSYQIPLTRAHFIDAVQLVERVVNEINQKPEARQDGE